MEKIEPSFQTGFIGFSGITGWNLDSPEILFKFP
jgi:hypothetical protein